MTTQRNRSNGGPITELQKEYAKHCGYRTFEELRENDEEALRIYYLQMI